MALMDLIFEQIMTGGDRNFGYLIADRKNRLGVLIDPSYSPEVLVERARAQSINIEYIINTHGHHDHINGNEMAKEMTGAKICAYETTEIPHDHSLKDGEIIKMGRYVLQMYHVPGHIDDHIVIYFEAIQAIFTGDHLFVGKIGGTGSDLAAKTQFNSLQRLFTLFPEHSTIWPGHDVGVRPSSTLFIERATNPFLEVDSVEAFIQLKRNWPEFKSQHQLK